jgi:deferrochelatase/peroxidase EfeB
VNDEQTGPSATALSRRKLLGLAGAATGGLVVGGVIGTTVARADTNDGSKDATPDRSGDVVAFHGTHQAGIATAAQDRLLFASFDVTSNQRGDVKELLRSWTEAATRLTAGAPVGPSAGRVAPPTDTGEATGLSPARLTLTFGFGPSLFVDPSNGDRFGLARRRPAALVDIPPFARDELDPAVSGGDICVQACGDDPQVLFHAIRNLTRIGRGTVVLRWSQEGFGRTSSTTSDQTTPRNLMGFKDGTANIRAGSSTFDRDVWVASNDDPSWMRGGSYLVARRIRILIETWDRSSLDDQQLTIGRERASGAPLGAKGEFDTIDLRTHSADGALAIPADAHVRVANQDANKIHILRRGYNFTDGVDARTGQLDAGLFFLAYQRDPRRQFIPLQARLAKQDALNEYIKHVGSAIFAVPPGVKTRDGHIGEGLFA